MRTSLARRAAPVGIAVLPSPVAQHHDYGLQFRRLKQESLSAGIGFNRQFLMRKLPLFIGRLESLASFPALGLIVGSYPTATITAPSFPVICRKAFEALLRRSVSLSPASLWCRGGRAGRTAPRT